MCVDTKEIMENTIMETQYMDKSRKIKFLESIATEDFDKKEDLDKLIINYIDKDDIIINKLQEYEYDKNYKYFTLYNIDSIDGIHGLEDLNDCLNNQENDFISKNIEKPTIKRYDNMIDFKFSKKIKSKSNKKYIKFPIIATVFLEEKVLAIKFCAISEEFNSSEIYININNEVRNWFENNIEFKITEFDSMLTFKHLYDNLRENPLNFANVTIHSISMDDEFNGRSSFKSTDLEMLPFIDDLSKLAETFENEKDKNKILEYIKRYESESIIRNMGITWKKIFKNSRGRLARITVSISYAYSLSNNQKKLNREFIMHHIYQEPGINKERINYVIKYITRYFNENCKKI